MYQITPYKLLKLHLRFCKEKPNLREEDKDYRAAKEIVCSKRVVNNTAERGVEY